MAIIASKPVKTAYRKSRQLVLKSPLYRLAYKVAHWRHETFVCPICAYNGPFRPQLTPDTVMNHSICLKCGSMERHRLQYLVMKNLAEQVDFSQSSMLHFAPEQHLRQHFRKWFYKYTTADLNRADVDYKADLRELPFESNTFDFVFASHVLEHIKDDERALSEISRVLAPTGAAILPVPIVATKTIEYPRPYEFGHIRAPGPDYYEKYKKHFARVKLFSSNDFSEEFQVFIYEDRTGWPSAQRPLARPIEGKRHSDIVAVAYASD